MMLAAELALAQVDVVILERRATPDPDRSRAGGLHARTIEVLDQRGVAERFLEKGTVMQIQGFGRIPLDISDFPTRHHYGLAIPQIETERLLATWVHELGVPTMREREVTGFTQDDTGVDVALSDGTSMRADYLVGYDGGRSAIRKAAGIEFAGWAPSTSWLMAEVEMVEKPEFGLRPGGGIGPAEDGDRIRVVLTEREVEHTGEPTWRTSARRSSPPTGRTTGCTAWSRPPVSRTTPGRRCRIASSRVLLAGDAAHVHPPLGGQGLNVGVQDAVNLGWKLAQVVEETSPQRLLDTYHEERHPVGARVLQTTMAQVALTTPGDRHDALRDHADRTPQHGRAAPASRRIAVGARHPLRPRTRTSLLGRRMPDLDIETAEGLRRVYGFLHDARPVLLNLDRPDVVDIAPWTDRVRLIDAGYRGPWELPVLGSVTAPAAVLIRPDGYVAWVGRRNERLVARRPDHLVRDEVAVDQVVGGISVSRPS